MLKALMPDGTPPPFPVFVTFVGVGNKNFGGQVDANGKIEVTMPQGRYYTELLVLNTEYTQGADGPSFFLEANEERDFGVIPLAQKPSADARDKALEANIANELGEVDGAGGFTKVFVLIIKLLTQILMEVRNISAELAGR